MILKKIVDIVAANYTKEELEKALVDFKPTEFNSKDNTEEKVNN